MEKTDPAFKEAKVALAKEEWERLENLFDTSKAVEDFAEGNMRVTDGEVFYKDQALHNHVVGRVLDFMSQGEPFKPLLRFLDKLMSNPSRRAVNELYTFLEHKAMPLTPDGNFLAYKGVREDYTDWHSGKFSNKVGDVNEMTRNGVCDDANIGCSHGFHAGSLEYAKDYGNGGHLMVVEIDPSDVVSVPLDCECQKLRTAKYKVVAHYEKKLEKPLCDEYGDYEDYENEDYTDSYDEGYNAGYEKAKKEFDGNGSVKIGLN
tara:strand:- start:323 stop:1105 length:783 start_codon:yes stop_codon:yes gene_type:complete